MDVCRWFWLIGWQMHIWKDLVHTLECSSAALTVGLLVGVVWFHQYMLQKQFRRTHTKQRRIVYSKSWFDFQAKIFWNVAIAFSVVTKHSTNQLPVVSTAPWTSVVLPLATSFESCERQFKPNKKHLCRRRWCFQHRSNHFILNEEELESDDSFGWHACLPHLRCCPILIYDFVICLDNRFIKRDKTQEGRHTHASGNQCWSNKKPRSLEIPTTPENENDGL